MARFLFGFLKGLVGGIVLGLFFVFLMVIFGSAVVEGYKVWDRTGSLEDGWNVAISKETLLQSLREARFLWFVLPVIAVPGAAIGGGLKQVWTLPDGKIPPQHASLAIRWAFGIPAVTGFVLGGLSDMYLLEGRDWGWRDLANRVGGGSDLSAVFCGAVHAVLGCIVIWMFLKETGLDPD